MSARLNIKIETRLEELSRVFDAVRDFGEREDWPTETVFLIDLALEELTLNTIDHGHDDGLHEIEIALNSEPGAITIEISDDGRPFDPLNDAPAPDVGAAIEDRPVGGLGVHLVRTLMDEMSYRREGNRNHITLVARKVQ